MKQRFQLCSFVPDGTFPAGFDRFPSAKSTGLLSTARCEVGNDSNLALGCNRGARPAYGATFSFRAASSPSEATKTLRLAPKQRASERDVSDQRATDADRNDERIGNVVDQLEFGRDRPAERYRRRQNCNSRDVG